MTTPSNRSVTVGCLALLVNACLPVDTRPPPGEALITVSSDETSSGISTADGWLVSFDTLLVSIGDFSLAEGECLAYGESRYTRILDVRNSEPQKLVLVRALGECPFIFDVDPPPEDAVLGAGVTEEQKTFMRTIGSDRYAENEGVAWHVVGSATQAERVIRFDWSFRETLFYPSCGDLAFEGEGETTADIRLRTGALFDDPDSGSPPEARFDPYAPSDGDGDGEVTLEELETIELSDPEYPTLGARLYRKTVAELPHVSDETPCESQRFDEK